MLILKLVREDLFFIICTNLLILALLEKAEISGDPTKPNHLVLCISSDRGLCGGVHSGLAKAVKANLLEKPAGTNTVMVLCGDKLKAILARTHSKLGFCRMSHIQISILHIFFCPSRFTSIKYQL